MPSTVTLAQTIAWAQGFLNFMPLTVGTNSEPAITSANTVLQTILSPPFAWRWNRAETTIQYTAAGTQDVTVALSNFSFLEKASVYVANDKIYELELKPVLADTSEQDRPQFIAVQKDDDAGNITFRVQPAPNQPYTVSLIYQLSSTPITGTGSTWGPIPDYLSYVYQWGFLALMSDYTDASNAARFRQLFVASLLTIAEGLEEQEKNVFIESWLGDIRQTATNQYGAQLAAKAKGT